MIEDEIKPDSAGAVEIRELGVKNIAMLTGDRRQAQNRQQTRWGLTPCTPGFCPIRRWRSCGKADGGRAFVGKLVFVGTGLTTLRCSRGLISGLRWGLWARTPRLKPLTRFDDRRALKGGGER